MRDEKRMGGAWDIGAREIPSCMYMVSYRNVRKRAKSIRLYSVAKNTPRETLQCRIQTMARPRGLGTMHGYIGLPILANAGNEGKKQTQLMQGCCEMPAAAL